MTVFRGMSGSRKGASHERDGTVCQDSTACYVTSEYSIAAVSDGHGGPAYFRSDVGSRIASESAVRIIREFVESEDFETSFRSSQDVLMDRVIRTILATWYSRVEDYDRTYPLTQEEYERIARDRIEEDPSDIHHHTRYGATLMASVLSDWFAFCIQIGDGDIACICEGGKDFSPMPEDPRCSGNTTTSLCQAEPLESFRTWSTIDRVPMAIVMSTDGVTNTFDGTDSYLRYCRTASCFVLDGGNQWERLMDRNKERADASSLDDASMAVICRECPELRSMKDDVDAKYKAIEERSMVVAKRDGKAMSAGTMRFEVSEKGAVLISYKGDDETVHVPERIKVDERSYVVVGIASRCFEKSGMRVVEIPATVTSIGKKAFFKCYKLVDVRLKGCPEMDFNSFFNCNRHSVVHYWGETPRYFKKNIELVFVKGRGPARRGIPSF